MMKDEHKCTDEPNMIMKFLERVDEVYPSPISPKVTDDCTLVKIYSKLMSQEDARIAMHLSAEPESAGSLAQRIGKSVEEVAPVLEKLANNGVIFMVFREEPLYCLIVFAPGTLEFSVKKELFDLDLVRLHKQFIKEMEQQVYHKLPKGALRVIPVQESIKAQSRRLPYEEVERYIDEATDIAAADCMCRLANRMLGHGCDHPYEGMCLWLGDYADFYERTGRGKRVTKEEAKAILKKAADSGLVHQMMVVQEGAPYLCNCCGCCCLGSLSIRKYFKSPDPALRSNYLPQIDTESCTGCETCIVYCQGDALQIEDGFAIVSEKQCLGCGVCAIHCPSDAIEMIPRKETIHPPKGLAEFAQEVADYVKNL